MRERGASRDRDADLPLDGEIRAVLDGIPDVDFTDLAAVRAMEREAWQNAPVLSAEGVEIHEVFRDRPAPTPPLRMIVCRPVGVEPTGILLMIHGGGFVAGMAEQVLPRGAALAGLLHCVVVSIDYRLAPEHPFPAALEDCVDAMEWTVAQAAAWGVQDRPVAVHGVSAGGGLATSLAQLARGRDDLVLDFQYLAGPMLDDRAHNASKRAFVSTPLWDSDKDAFAWRCYLGVGESGESRPGAVAGRATDLRGMPPTYLAVYEYDPLREEGIRYAEALMRDEVPVELHMFPGTAHCSSVLVPDAAISVREQDEEVAVLRQVFRRQPVDSA